MPIKDWYIIASPGRIKTNERFAQASNKNRGNKANPIKTIAELTKKDKEVKIILKK